MCLKKFSGMAAFMILELHRIEESFVLPGTRYSNLVPAGNRSYVPDTRYQVPRTCPFFDGFFLHQSQYQPWLLAGWLGQKNSACVH